MDDTHPDLVTSSEQTINFEDDNDATFRADIHGTALGGVIAAEADNETGMVGAKPAHDDASFPVSVPGTIAVDMPERRESEISAPVRRVPTSEANACRAVLAARQRNNSYTGVDDCLP